MPIASHIDPFSTNRPRYSGTPTQSYQAWEQIIDYATRYPEAVPLRNIETETVADALINHMCRMGFASNGDFVYFQINEEIVACLQHYPHHVIPLSSPKQWFS